MAAVTPQEGVSQPIAAPSGREAKLTRHASFNVPPSRSSAHRLVNSAPCSPTSRPAGEALLETVSVNAAKPYRMLMCLLLFLLLLLFLFLLLLLLPLPLLHSGQ